MLIALHGFLGLPSDWKYFDGCFVDRNGAVLEIEKRNLYRDLPAEPPIGKVSPLREWAQSFCDRLRASQEHGAEKPVLLGYSMGGRLALHALIRDESLFAGAVIVAAHPGLASADMRMQRKLNDAAWAERFRTEEWSALTSAWGTQEVFRYSDETAEKIELVREEHEFSRTLLARALLAWSLAEQDNLRKEIAALKLPVLWLTGAQDRKFNSLMEDFAPTLGPSQSWEKIPAASHRVPWENPREFCARVQEMLNKDDNFFSLRPCR